MFHEFGFGSSFLDMTLNEQATKEKKCINWAYSKLKKKLLYNRRHYQERQKTSHKMGEKIFSNYVFEGCSIQLI